MVYYQQTYRHIYLICSFLKPLAFLAMIILMGCNITELRSIQPHSVNPESSLAQTDNPPVTEEELRQVEALLREYDITHVNKTKEWECEVCTYRSPLFSNICQICSKQRPIDKSKEWKCRTCTFQNPLSAKTCEACGPKAFVAEDASLVKPNPQKIEIPEECAICLEPKWQKKDTHACRQCKKEICNPCYKNILEKMKIKICPLCRATNY